MGHLDSALSAISALVPSWLTPRREPPQTVREIDLQRFAGKWYEIAALRTLAERDRHHTTQTFHYLEEGDLEVIHRSVDTRGTIHEIEGRAWVADPSAPGRLKLQLHWPLRTDYWILALGDACEYAMIGDPSRQHLWILSRSPFLEPSIYHHLLDEAREQGYELARLRRTSHA